MATGLQCKLQRAGEGRRRNAVDVKLSEAEFEASDYTFRKNKYKMYIRYT